MKNRPNSVAFRMLHVDQLSASTIILSILGASAVETQPKLLDERWELTASELSAAAQLFGIETSAVRMALTRLFRANRVEKTKRGQYGLGVDALNINAHASNWRERPNWMCKWTGAWRIVITAHIDRTDRRAQRQRERALSLWGFVEAERGVWVRPANLAQPLAAHRTILNGLGLSGEEMHLQAEEAIGQADQGWTTLWPIEELRSGYQSALQVMADSAARLSALSLQDAARESFLVGQSVIRCIGLDPLLPEEITNTDLFRELHQTMIAYDDVGRKIWRDFLQT